MCLLTSFCIINRIRKIRIWEYEIKDWECTFKKRLHKRGGDRNKTKEIIQKEYEIIEELSHKFTIESLCMYMEVSRSGFYKWRKRKGIYNRYQMNQETAKGHMTALNQFLEEKIKRGYTLVETILHSDQGTVYASRAFQNAHKQYNIKRSMSRAKTPTDNPIIEALNGWMKDELYIDFDLNNTNDIPKTIADYVRYFNNERLAYSLEYKTPFQVKLERGFN